MAFIFNALQFALWLFMLVLFARVILGLVLSLARDWHPTGVSMVLTEAVFSITDPPLKALRKVIRPLQLGAVRLDLAFLVLFFSCYLVSFVLTMMEAVVVGPA
ncbi:YggT family protein [Demequina sp.]|uniref:YggT family protein n=1 Tax=Demequina sp. TaxID=2050685 RepID=UPI003A84F941